MVEDYFCAVKERGVRWKKKKKAQKKTLCRDRDLNPQTLSPEEKRLGKAQTWFRFIIMILGFPIWMVRLTKLAPVVKASQIFAFDQSSRTENWKSCRLSFSSKSFFRFCIFHKMAATRFFCWLIHLIRKSSIRFSPMGNSESPSPMRYLRPRLAVHNDTMILDRSIGYSFVK